MPGKHGLEALRELREADPNLAIVMVTKSEEDSTMTEAIGAALDGYLVKPVTPRQVYAAITRLLEGAKIRQQAVARKFVERFRDLQTEQIRGMGWREWIDRYSELTQWDLDLVAANETGSVRVAAGTLSRSASRVRAVHAHGVSRVAENARG